MSDEAELYAVPITDLGRRIMASRFIAYSPFTEPAYPFTEKFQTFKDLNGTLYDTIDYRWISIIRKEVEKK